MTSTYFIHLQKKLQRLICTKPNRFEQKERGKEYKESMNNKEKRQDRHTDR